MHRTSFSYRVKFRMDFYRLIFNFFVWVAAQFDGITDPVNAQSLYTKMEGEDFRVTFNFNVPEGSRKYLCKNNCEKEDILIETNGNRLRSEKYIITYNSTEKRVHAVVTALKKSDAGYYKVGYSTDCSLGSYTEFELKVRDMCEEVVVGEPRVYSAAEGGNLTVRCSLFLHPRNRKFLCREECERFLVDTNDEIATSDRYKIKYGGRGMFNVTFARLTKSDSGRYRCGVGSNKDNNTCQEFEITVTGGEVSPLVVSVTVVVAVLLAGSLLLLLLLFKCKTSHVHYVNTAVNAKPREFAPSEDSAAASRREEQMYQDLDPHTRDGSLYSTLSV